jgi:hypothetical protein
MQAEGGKKLGCSLSLYALFFLIPLLFPHAAWAVQQHGGAEGLVSHQIGHLLFIFGMFYLLYRLHLSSPSGPGWKEFKLFVWLIICWNFLTFYGHWHQELIDPAKFLQINGKTSGFMISGPIDVLFYFSRLDHLVLLPAFLYLLTALAKWRKHA